MDYYNEFDKYPAQWLRNLQTAGHIPQGKVDERSIADVRAEDLEGVRSAHFFAGIGGWPLALKLAGWPEDQEVWTGSCPCQPFSVAGARRGKKDKRHLWPEFFRLIGKRCPTVVFGEQVASADGRAWFSGVRADLETLGYAVGGADLCAAGAGEEGEGWVRCGDQVRQEPVLIGAPHIRQRLFWVAVSKSFGHRKNRLESESWRRERAARQDDVSVAGRLAHVQADGRLEVRPNGQGSDERSDPEGRPARPGLRGTSGGMADGGQRGQGDLQKQAGPYAANPWSSFDVLDCADGKARRVESGTFPLVDGVPARVGKLRAYGNAIVPEEAAEFIQAFLECFPR